MIIFLSGADYEGDGSLMMMMMACQYIPTRIMMMMLFIVRWGTINLFAALVSILIATLVSHSLLRFFMMMIMIWRMRIMVILIDFDDLPAFIPRSYL